MKLRNRILSAVMAIAACMTFVGTSALAADGYDWTWTPSVDGLIKAGTEFTVTLDITENAGLVNLNAEVSYDAEGLEMTAKPTITSILGTNSSAAVVANPYTISVGDGLENVFATGTLATFSFKALKDGEWDITLKGDPDNTMDEFFEFYDLGSKVVTIKVGEEVQKTPATATVVDMANNFAANKVAYTQGYKVEVVGNDETVTGLNFTFTLDGNTSEEKTAFTGLNITGTTPSYCGLNVINVPASVAADTMVANPIIVK